VELSIITSIVNPRFTLTRPFHYLFQVRQIKCIILSDKESHHIHVFAEDGRQAVLHPGTYEYSFSIPLPPKIPSSVEGHHGFIRYFLEAVIQRPWKDEQAVQTMVYVTNVSDLNVNPEAALPSSFQKQKHVGFNPCQNGPISLAFMIGKTGFVPGEYLQFGVEIRNTSGVRINRVHISLKRVFEAIDPNELISVMQSY